MTVGRASGGSPWQCRVQWSEYHGTEGRVNMRTEQDRTRQGIERHLVALQHQGRYIRLDHVQVEEALQLVPPVAPVGHPRVAFERAGQGRAGQGGI